MEFILNEQAIKTDRPGGTTLLDFIRYENHLTGTKIGCREGDCGACTVLIGELKNGTMHYMSMTSCISPLANAAGKHVVTIEGLNMKSLSPVQKAFVDAGGTQCGFCTVGFIVSLTGYCLSGKKASYESAISAVDGNICRCTGYKSIERAVEEVADKLSSQDITNPIEWLVYAGYIPEYFLKIPERLSAISTSNSGISSNAIVVGGGTDLYVQRPEELALGEVNSFYGRKELKEISIEGDRCKVGASVTVADLLESPVFNKQFSNLKKYLKLVSSTQIRNMGTVAGNFVNASPIGDLTIFFLALNSSITLKNKSDQRRIILLKDFYKGYKTLDKQPDEYIERVHFDVMNSNTFFNFEKISKRTNLDIASVNTALRLEMNGEKITEIYAAAGGVGPVPLFLEKTCAFLKEKTMTADTLVAATEILSKEISPISDARGSKEYKALLLRQLFFAHFIELFPEKFELDMFV